MNLKGTIKKFGVEFADTVKKNSPSLLGATAILCMLGAVVTAWKAKDKVDEAIIQKKMKIKEANKKNDISEEEIDKEIKEATKKCVKDVAFAMAPTIIFAGLSATCIIGAQKINNKRIAALSAAYTLAEKNYDELKNKVKEMYGEGKAQKIDDEIRKDHAKEKLGEEHIDNCIVQNTGFGNDYFLDDDSGQVFLCDLNSLRAKVNDFNQELIETCNAYFDSDLADNYEQSCEDIYKYLGLHVPSWAPLKVWRRSKLMDLSWTVTTMSINGINHEVYIVKFINEYKTYEK